ncbi:CLUMA_CG012870, isoform A [Clunio marinus]|uniref:CLUMA_CG012870, isoform A n=1 Tax=Clunio marinus TaxID=568069 RepID=A0A1J1IM57_9DIPT|nr:CLUMA_CG012870, isoform A [Clunio marinus]
MASSQDINDIRRHNIPVVYARGNHYDVGFDVGRTFSAMIKDFVSKSALLNSSYLPIYNTPQGKKVYNETLEVVTKSFPQYLRELQGVADGAGVEFYKLFLFHLDEILPNVAKQRSSGIEPTGCSTVYVNGDKEEILGHTEDASRDSLNAFYLVSAHIISQEPEGKYGVKVEKFTSLCYAGHLPGYTMSYNHHGLILTINTLVARTLNGKKTPRHFITRALLAAENYDEAIKILKDFGVGAADGCSLNLTFLNGFDERKFYNIELGPALPSSDESLLDIQAFGTGECSIHCNNYLRLKVLECVDPYMNSTKERYQTLIKFSEPRSLKGIIQMLGDQTGENWIFRDRPGPVNKTICVGIFDLKRRTWSLYKDNPKTNEPLLILHLELKNQK